MASCDAACMCPFRFQNWRRLTPPTSTMLVDSVMGVRACSRSVSCEHSGCAKRVRFSYSANRRTSFVGVEEGGGAALE